MMMLKSSQRARSFGTHADSSSHATNGNSAVNGTAYCLVKSCPRSYQEMVKAAADGGSIVAVPHTLVMLPHRRQFSAITPIPIVEELRSILADEATPLDAETRSIWSLQLDPLTVMNTLSKLGFHASNFDVNSADNVHTWTMVASTTAVDVETATTIEKPTVAAKQVPAPEEDSTTHYIDLSDSRSRCSDASWPEVKLHRGSRGPKRQGESGPLQAEMHGATSFFAPKTNGRTVDMLYNHDVDDEGAATEKSVVVFGDEREQGNGGTYFSDSELVDEAVVSEPVAVNDIDTVLQTMRKRMKKSLLAHATKLGKGLRAHRRQKPIRVRTFIHAEQTDYMFDRYKVTKFPDYADIAARTGLDERVVWRWYRNARDRERRGELRVVHESINKRCPECGVRFSARSALNNHYTAKHGRGLKKKKTDDSADEGGRIIPASIIVAELPDTDTEGPNDESITSFTGAV